MPNALPYKTIRWVGGLDGCVELIDQTLLPERLEILSCHNVETLCEAIRNLRVRGAPAIGVAAAMGVVLGTRGADTTESFFENLSRICAYLATSRPTAVNLSWALERMRSRAEALRGQSLRALQEAMLAEAQAVRDEDEAVCRAIGQVGEGLIQDGAGVLTHCNAGGLATAAYGTALAIMFCAHERGRRFRVYADETRPLLQGSRLTAWELARAGIDVTVICDSMAAWLMKDGRVDLVVVGADRIAANGDTANKIGTYGLAVLAKAHDVPFYVAAPRSTFDLDCPDGSAIPIETRSEDEVRRGFGRLTAPEGVACHNPAFDVTPAELIWGVVTEGGVLAPVTQDRVREFFANRACNGGRRR